MAKKHTDSYNEPINSQNSNIGNIENIENIETMDDLADYVPSVYDKDIDNSDDSTNDINNDKINSPSNTNNEVLNGLNDDDIIASQSGNICSKKFKEDVYNFLYIESQNILTDSEGNPLVVTKPNPKILNASKNQLYKFATDWYLTYITALNTNIAEITDNVETELLYVTQQCFKLFNEQDAVTNKSIPKLKMPDELSTSQIADILAALYPIARINCCEQSTDVDYDLLGLYIDSPGAKAYGTYVTDDDVFRVLARKFSYNMTEKQFKEINLALRDKVPRKLRNDDRDLIAVNNGIFDYSQKKLLPFSPDYVFLTKSQVSYNENATNVVIHNNEDGTDWDVESWIAEIADDPEIEQVIWEILGAIIRPNVHWNKSAWFYSETGNNGKGTLCELMRQLCGDTSYASIPLADFGKDFVLEPLTRASAIIVDENDVGTFIDKAGNLKSVITNDVIQINRKYKIPIAYQFKGFMVQCLNEYPRIKDKSDSFYRRQLFIPFSKCFTGKERKYIKHDYLHRKEVLEYVLYKILNSNYYTLSEPTACHKILNEYKEYNDPVRLFFDELQDEFVWNFLPFTFLYDMYKAWFKLNIPSGTCIGKIMFTNDLINVIRSNHDWVCEDKSKKYRVTPNLNMDKPEPLIMKYNMTEWMAPYYAGKDPDQICRPRLADSYRGIIKIRRDEDDDDNITEETPQE